MQEVKDLRASSLLLKTKGVPLLRSYYIKTDNCDVSLLSVHPHMQPLSRTDAACVTRQSDVHSEAADLLPATLARLRSAEHIIKFRFQ